MPATSGPKIKTRDEPLDLSLTEIAGENVLERFRQDVRNVGLDLEIFENRVGSLLRPTFPRSLPSFWGGAIPGPVDLEDAGSEFKVHVDLPGVKKEEAMIRFLDQILEVRTEAQKVKEMERKNFVYRGRAEAAFVSRVEFPTPVVPEKAEAKLENGVLTVAVPKLKPSKEHVVRLG